jgi:SpoVK/Ycf46/Vps4 family AAA+-type ATPase
MHFQRAKNINAAFILDNLSAICPKEDDPKTLMNTIKTEIFSQMVTDWIEAFPDVPIIAVSRHFTQINPKIFDIGILDNLLELQAPTKEQRYDILNSFNSPFGLSLTDLALQSLSQASEFFMARDLF